MPHFPKMSCQSQYLADPIARTWQPCPNDASMRLFQDESGTIRLTLCEWCASNAGAVAATLATMRVIQGRQAQGTRTIERLTQSLGWALNRLEYGPALSGDEHDTEQLRRARLILKSAAELGYVAETTFSPNKETR